MYQKVTTDLNFVEREKEVSEFWKEHDIFRKSMEQRKDGETYTFYDDRRLLTESPISGMS